MKSFFSLINLSRAVFITIALSISIIAQGQNSSIFGKLLDAKSGGPLVGATIQASPTGLTATSNGLGAYELKLPPGKYRICVSHIGYDLHEANVQLSQGEKKEIDVYLVAAPNILNAVIIKEKYVREIPYIQHTLTKGEIEMMPVRDIGDQLRMLPNVGGIKKGGLNIDPVVRGFKYSQLTTLLDGAIAIEGGCPNRMDPTTSHIALDDMAEMQVLKGPFALRYGAIFGGVVNLVPVKPVASDIFNINVKAIKAFESNWVGNREYANISGGNKRIYFMVSGFNQKYGNYTDGNGVLYQTANHKFGYKGAIGFRPLPNHETMLCWSQSMSKGIMFPALPMDDRSDDSKVLSFDYKIGKVNEHLNSVDLKLYKSDVLHVMDNKQKPFSDTTVAISTVIAGVTGGRLETGLNIGGGHLYFGVDRKRITKEGERIKTMIMQIPGAGGKVPIKPEQLWNDAVINEAGIFSEYKRKIENLDIIGAIRFDYNSAYSDTIKLLGVGTPPPVLMSIDSTESNFMAVSFSGGATYNFSEKFAVNVAAGRGTRFPNMLERFIISLPVDFDNFEYIGNPSLKPEINNEIDLNIKYVHPVYGGVDFTIFGSYVQNHISGERIPPAQQKPLTDNVLGVKRFQNFETAFFTGFELSARSPEKYDLAGNIVASYTRGVIHNTVTPIIDPTKPPLQSVIGDSIIAKDPASEIPPFETTISVRYRMLNGKFIPSISWRVVANQNFVSGSYKEEKTKGFNIINLNAIYKHNQYLTLSGGITNLLNTAYYEHLSRRIIGSSLSFYEPGRVFYINAIINI